MQMTIDGILQAQLRAQLPKGPDTFFESREWKSWAACRKPKEAIWDRRRKVAAQLQRQLAQTLRLQYQYFRMIDGTDTKGDPFFVGEGIASVSDLEAKAREMMDAMDVRSKF